MQCVKWAPLQNIYSMFPKETCLLTKVYEALRNTSVFAAGTILRKY